MLLRVRLQNVQITKETNQRAKKTRLIIQNDNGTQQRTYKRKNLVDH